MRSAASPVGGQPWLPLDAFTAVDHDLSASVHVWRARVGGLPPDWSAAMSADEVARAARFCRDEDRNRFVSARTNLRRILALHLGLAYREARRLCFGYGAAGKPYLRDDAGLHFNVAHSHDLVLVAATRAGELGVDVERRRPVGDMDGIARLVFCDAELAVWSACPAADKAAMFLRLWTRKEALAKATGAGLAALGTRADGSSAESMVRWIAADLPHLDGYAAALARPCGAAQLRLWSVPSAAGMRSTERRRGGRPAAPANRGGCEVRA